MCDKVDVYGVSVSYSGIDNVGSPERTTRDSNFRLHVEQESDKSSCCYYPLEEDYKPEVVQMICPFLGLSGCLLFCMEPGKVAALDMFSLPSDDALLPHFQGVPLRRDHTALHFSTAARLGKRRVPRVMLGVIGCGSVVTQHGEDQGELKKAYVWCSGVRC